MNFGAALLSLNDQRSVVCNFVCGQARVDLQLRAQCFCFGVQRKRDVAGSGYVACGVDLAHPNRVQAFLRCEAANPLAALSGVNRVVLQGSATGQTRDPQAAVFGDEVTHCASVSAQRYLRRIGHIF